MSAYKRKLVVVLGMHRSGTSAITRGLETLGVELGDHLLPARDGNNPKGFLEDIDINSLNIEMLNSFGDDWDRLSPVQTLDVARLQESGYLLRAVELIRNKFKHTQVFGFKDPRVAKLLPFWKAVFAQMQLEVSYVLALRNPLSVVRSLEKRDNLDAGKVYLLWAQHVIASLFETEQCKRIVVNFDRILQAPNVELERVAAHLNLKLDREKLQIYGESFLDKDLQHTVYERDDLLLDVACPPLVIELFDAMLAGAVDGESLGSESFKVKVRAWQSEFQRLRAPMVLIDKVTAARDLGRLSVIDLEREVVSLRVHLSDLSQTIDSLLLDRDSQKAGLAQSQSAFLQLGHERDEQVAHFTHAIDSLVRDRDEQVIHFTRAIESLILDRDSQKAGLAKTQSALLQLGHERDGQVAHFTQAIESLILDRDSQKAGLAKTQSALLQLGHERDGQVITITGLNNEVERLAGELSKVYLSRSWRVTSPMRKFVRWIGEIRAGLGRGQHGTLVMPLTANPELVSAPRSQPSIPTEPEAPRLADKASNYRILLVSYYCPTRAHAGGLRILDIYAMLRKKCPDARIDLFTHHRPNIDWSMDGLESIFDNVYLSQTENLSLGSLVQLQGNQVQNYDLVDLQFHQSAYHLEAFRAIASKVIFTPMESQAKVLFLDFSAKLKSGKLLGFRRVTALINLAVEEIGFCRKADEVVCVSRTDASFLRAISGARKVRGIDTGISQFEFAQALESDFQPGSAGPKALKIVFIAYFGSETNVVALKWFLETVHPLIKVAVPNYVLSVVGRGDLSSFEKFLDGNLELVGEVPMIASYISEARVGIAPALGGSGLRGKINQYAVLGVPSVASPIALKGLAYRDGENVCVAESPKEFANKCISLLTDVELNDRIAVAARKLCLDRYSWQSKWPQIRSVYGIKSTA